MEDQVDDSWGISFVGNVPWVVEGTDVDDVVRKLEQCAATSPRWADDNTVRFETSKTEVILLSRKSRHRNCIRGAGSGIRRSVSRHRQHAGWVSGSTPRLAWPKTDDEESEMRDRWRSGSGV